MNGLGLRRAIGGLAACLALILAAPPPAGAAEFGIADFAVRMLDREGDPMNVAGSHPDRLQIDFALNVAETGTATRDIVFELPPGLGSNADAVPKCPRELFEAGEEECPPESQVGVLRLGPAELPLFVVEPGPDEIVRFGSRPGVDLPLKMSIRPDDYGITLEARELPQVAIDEGRAELWGVPADRQEGTAIPRRPMLTAPTRCERIPFTFRTRSWQDGAPWLSATADTGAPLEGCDGLSFAPRLGLRLSNPVADSPTGAGIDLEIPQEEDPDGQATAQVEDLTVQLPDGIAVSPGGAASLSPCTDDQLGLGTAAPAACPAASRVGTAELASPLLDGPLDGLLFLGEERPGERFRLFVVVDDRGVAIKLATALRADPATGRLSMTMNDLPQVPLSRLTLDIAGGPGALLASPLDCGPATATARFQPYGGGPAVEPRASASIAPLASGTPCPGPGPFAPTVTATSSNPRAGRPTAISMRIERRPGEQLPARFAIGMPAGLNALVATVEPCSGPAAATGDCPPGSRIGSVLAGVGSGPDPVALRGGAFLAGPYRGAPFSMLLAFRAAIGPFDLGTTAIRAALRLDGRSGRAAILTDRLPAAVEGVPIRFRTIGFVLDRPGLIVNPTSCAPTGIETTIEAAAGATATLSSPIPVRGCRRLGFAPRFTLSLSGRSQLHRGGHPRLRVSTRLRRGDANLRGLRFSLPPVLGMDSSGLGELCSHRDAVRGDCPRGSRAGGIAMRTPLLDGVLRGSMHVVQPLDDGPPDVWLSATAMGMSVDMRGETLTRDGRLAIRLAGMPDIPISALTMRMAGGDGGLLRLDAGLCDGGIRRRVSSALTARAQNDKQRRLRVPIGIGKPCGGR